MVGHPGSKRCLVAAVFRRTSRAWMLMINRGDSKKVAIVKTMEMHMRML